MDYETSAAFLYGGGWRSTDADELMQEYDLSEEEAISICNALAALEC